MEHQDILGPHKGACVLGGHGGDHDLGKPDGKCPHDRRAKGRPHGAADLHNTVDLFLFIKVACALDRPPDHDIQCLSLVADMLNLTEGASGRLCHTVSADIHRKGALSQYPCIHDDDSQAFPLQAFLQEHRLLSFRVHGSDDQNTVRHFQ